MKYFTFTEFERSDTATKFAIDNSIPESAKKNIAALVDTVLDPLREAWGKPINVTSGYRNATLNPLVGGSRTSQHMTGEAADICIFARDENGNMLKDKNGNFIIDKVANRKLFQMIQDLHLPFDQLIDENDFSWVHVSHRRNGANRGEIKKLYKK